MLRCFFWWCFIEFIEYKNSIEKYIGDRLELIEEITNDHYLLVNNKIIIMLTKFMLKDVNLRYIDYYINTISFSIENVYYILLPELIYLIHLDQFNNQLIINYLDKLFIQIINKEQRNIITLDTNVFNMEQLFTIFKKK